jgi:hypothetical protein
MMLEKEWFVVGLKWFLEIDLLPFLQVSKMGANMLMQPKDEIPKMTSSTPGMGMNLNYLHQ